MPEITGGAINHGPEVTFGCGAFLPGEGPFSFVDFPGGIDDIDTPLDSTGVPPGTGVDDNEIDIPPRDPQEGTGPFGGGVITPGSQFKVGCNVDGAVNYDPNADGCTEGDSNDFGCCEFLGGCPDPSFDNYVAGAWGCGGAYEDQGNTECCENEDDPPDLGNPVINLGNGDIVPGWGESGENYGEELFVDITLYTGAVNPTGELFSVFTPLKWDLNGAGVAVGGTFNSNPNGYTPTVTLTYFNRWAPTQSGFENIIFQNGTGLIGMKNFTADFGPGVPWNGSICEGVVSCNPTTQATFQCDWINPHPAGGGAAGFFFITININWIQGFGAGAGDGSTGSTLSIPQIIKRVGSALLPKKRTEVSRDTIISKAVAENRLDLNDPMIKARITSDNPTGIMDADIAYEVDPAKTKMISNDTGSSDLFGPKIDENVSYIIKNNEFVKDWDATKPRGVTERAILRSLTPEARWYLSRIKNYDGTPINTSQRFAMIGSRILDGT